MEDFDTPKRDYFLRYTAASDSRILGRGSYGIVLKAKYKENNVAVKIISKHDRFKYASIKRERNILSLSHENLIKILKIVETKDYGAVIMERFEYGKNLQFILDRCCDKISLKNRLKILKDVSRALMFCHRNNIVHRDLKPDNLMIVLNSQRRDFICKLFDFGCSYKFCSSRRADDVLNGNDDSVGTSIVGTIRYSAPELLQGTVNYSIDVYSFGILMWQLKENKIPYEAIKSNEVILYQVVKNNLRPDYSTLLPLEESGEFGRENSHKGSRLEVSKPSVKSFTPTKLLNVCNNIPKMPKSDFKHEKFLSKCASRCNKGITRKKLLESLDCCDENESDFIQAFVDLLTDHQPFIKGDYLLRIEKEYVRMYKACWDENHLLRPKIERICNLIDNFINSL